MKKLISMLLVLTLVLSLAACGNSDDADTGNGGGGSKSTEAKKDDKADTSAAASDEPLTFPLDEQIKLSVFVHTRPGTDDFDNNEFTYWLEEQTNIDLEFIVAPENEAKEKLNLLLATGDYPDIILTKQLNTPQIAYFGSQGTFIPMNDLIEQYGTYTKEAFAQYPIAEELFTMPDGNIYNLPQINACYHCQSTQKLWIYKPWLDTLGLDVPQTTEEFTEVLRAFKTQDPNGNGIADEVPMSASVKGWGTDVDLFLMNSFVYNAGNQGGAERLFVEDGKVVASYVQDGWREGLKYLQMLRQEGLLDANAFTQDTETLRQLGENPDTMILGVAPGGFMGTASQIAGESGRWKDWVTVPPLEGPNGVRTTFYNPFVGNSGGSITDACENPEAAFMLLDLMYSDEGTFRNTIGRPGIEYEYVTEGEGLNGEPAFWNELIPKNEQDPNVQYNQLGPNFRSSDWRLGRLASEEQYLEVALYKETKDNYSPYWPDVDSLLPPVILTEDQSAQLLQYSTTINDYVREKIAYFALGDMDIDAEWDGYIAELNAMGIDPYLAVWQEAYDAR